MRLPSRRAGTAAAVLLAAALGCGHAPAFRCEQRNGRRWREVRTPHVVLRTDLGRRAAVALAEELEVTLTGLSWGLLQRDVTLPGPVDVVALDSAEGLDRLLPADTVAGVTPSLWSQPVIVMPGSFDRLQRMVVAHELTHVLLAGWARQPWWFREGLATYAETIAWEGSARRLTLGRIPRHRVRHVFHRPQGLREILAGGTDFDADHYATAWALVHFLLNRHPHAFQELQARFARGEEPREAWAAEFPLWATERPDGPERLERELRAYLDSDPAAWVFPRPRPGAPAVEERPLGSAEVHDLRLSLPWLNRGRPVPRDAVLEEIREALSEDPGSPSALALLGILRGGEEEALARRATELHPDDWRAWLLASIAARDGEPAVREAALRRAAELEPRSAPALAELAGLLLAAGDVEAAHELAARAARIAPFSPPFLDTLAATLEERGRCPEALGVQRRALDLLGSWPGRHAPVGAAPLVERRDRLEARCGTDAPVAAGP